MIKFGKLEAEEHADISEENEIVAVYVLNVLNVLTQCCRPRPSSLLSILLSILLSPTLRSDAACWASAAMLLSSTRHDATAVTALLCTCLQCACMSVYCTYCGLLHVLRALHPDGGPLDLCAPLPLHRIMTLRHARCRPTIIMFQGGKRLGRVDSADAFAVTKLVDSHKGKVAAVTATAAAAAVPAAAAGEAKAETTEQLNKRIGQIINAAPVMLFMKGAWGGSQLSLFFASSNACSSSFRHAKEKRRRRTTTRTRRLINLVCYSYVSLSFFFVCSFGFRF